MGSEVLTVLLYTEIVKLFVSYGVHPYNSLNYIGMQCMFDLFSTFAFNQLQETKFLHCKRQTPNYSCHWIQFLKMKGCQMTHIVKYEYIQLLRRLVIRVVSTE